MKYIHIITLGLISLTALMNAENSSTISCPSASLLIGEIKALASITRESTREINTLMEKVTSSDNPTLINIIAQWSKIGYQAGILLEKITNKLEQELEKGDVQELTQVAHNLKESSRAIDKVRDIRETSSTTPTSSVTSLPDESSVSPSTTKAPDTSAPPTIEITPLVSEDSFTNSLSPTENSIPTETTTSNVENSSLESSSISTEVPPLPQPPTFDEPISLNEEDNQDIITSFPTDSTKTPDLSSATAAVEKPTGTEGNNEENERSELDTLQDAQTEELTHLPVGAPSMNTILSYGPIDKTRETIVKQTLQKIVPEFEEHTIGAQFITLMDKMNELYTFAQANKEYYPLFEKAVAIKNEDLINEIEHKIVTNTRHYVDTVQSINQLLANTKWYRLYPSAA